MGNGVIGGKFPGSKPCRLTESSTFSILARVWVLESPPRGIIETET